MIVLWLNQSMRWIYLSPHLDDAVLSAGGLIYEQVQSGIPVEIWTLMSGFPPKDEEYSFLAQKNHLDWGYSSAEETVRARRAEDVTAANILGAKTVHFDFLDCIYRRGRNGEWLYNIVSVLPEDDGADLSARSMKAITSLPHVDDEGLPRKIADAISPRLKSDDKLVCQLSVGSHVDHVLVRQAAELLGWNLIYDIDVPYIFTKPEELAQKSAGMQENVHSVTKSSLKSWKVAVLAYASQLPVLGDAMKTPEKATESIQSYWTAHRGIRLFQLN